MFNWVKFDDFFLPPLTVSLRMTSKNNRAPLLCQFKLYASFHSHRWIPIWITVRKRTNGVWPLWPWPLTLIFCMDITLSLVITPENFMMIRWQEHSKNVWRADGQTEGALAQVCYSRIHALSPDEYHFHLVLHWNFHHSQVTYPKWLNH